MMTLSEHAKGLLAGVVAYSAWGILPIFWKLVGHVPATQVLAHRIIWSCVSMLLLLTLLGRLTPLLKLISDRKILSRYFTSGFLVSFNWGLFIWAVNNDMVLQASLGYFIAPLVNVMLGRYFLRESLTSFQTIAISLMCLAVSCLVITAGQFPWVAILLALSFCLYGLIRKTGTLGAISGLLLESTLITPFAIAYLIFTEAQFPAGDIQTTLLLILAGPATAFPLVFFASAAKRLALKTLGMLQYLAPTGQFLLGVLLYNEEISGSMLISFSIIWIALGIYVTDAYRNRALTS